MEAAARKPDGRFALRLSKSYGLLDRERSMDAHVPTTP